MDGSNIEIGGNYSVAADELRAFIERVEKINAQEADLKLLKKEVYAEAKGRGYMTRPMRTVVKLRAEDPDKRAEEEAALELYKTALGMS